jgi:hypothetical protein
MLLVDMVLEAKNKKKGLQAMSFKIASKPFEIHRNKYEKHLP